MGEVVNLRLLRKRKARADKEQAAERNRAAYGRTRAERERDEAEAERTRAFLDGHRRDVRDDGAPE
ncbi:MAG: DUF4169 family protein [Aquamicrobium sp.]|nr:DUF4169 family protein [Aquamicrobium sp.]